MSMYKHHCNTWLLTLITLYKIYIKQHGEQSLLATLDVFQSFVLNLAASPFFLKSKKIHVDCIFQWYHQDDLFL